MSSDSLSARSSNQSLLLVGLIFNATLNDAARAAYGTAEEIEQAVRHDEVRAEKAGFSVTSYQIDPAMEQEGLKQFKAYLASGQFDAIMIGSGIRMVVEQTPLFETMINMCRTITPNTPLMFNAAPGTMTKCLERLYGASFDY